MAIRKININDSEISVIFGLRDDDYICLTDMVKAGDNSDRTNIVIQNWMRRKDTISYLGVWENLHNHNFNCHFSLEPLGHIYKVLEFFRNPGIS